MMISPYDYAARYLYGKSVEQIEKKIDDLRKVMESLKRKMEHPDYRVTYYPTEDTMLSCHREYLKMAIYELEKAGGTYSATAADLKYHAFCGSIKYINKIIFTSGTLKKGFKMRIIEIKGETPTFRTAFL